MLPRIVIMRMLDDAFADFEREIEAAKCGVALLKILDDAEGVQVVVKRKAVLAHGCIQCLFAGMAERRVADVVHQGQRFGVIDVQAERSGNGARDLRDFQRMGEAVAEMVAVAPGENLRLGLEAAEGAGRESRGRDRVESRCGRDAGTQGSGVRGSAQRAPRSRPT